MRRVLVTYFNEFRESKGKVTCHIQSRFSKEMAKKSETVSEIQYTPNQCMHGDNTRCMIM